MVQLPGESAINSAEVYATLSRIAEDSIHNVWPKDAPRPSMRPVMEASYFSVTALQNQHFLSFSQIANPEMIHSHPFFIAMSRISSWTSTTPPLKKKNPRFGRHLGICVPMSMCPPWWSFGGASMQTCLIWVAQLILYQYPLLQGRGYNIQPIIIGYNIHPTIIVLMTGYDRIIIC